MSIILFVLFLLVKKQTSIFTNIIFHTIFCNLLNKQQQKSWTLEGKQSLIFLIEKSGIKDPLRAERGQHSLTWPLLYSLSLPAPASPFRLICPPLLRPRRKGYYVLACSGLAVQVNMSSPAPASLFRLICPHLLRPRRTG